MTRIEVALKIFEIVRPEAPHHNAQPDKKIIAYSHALACQLIELDINTPGIKVFPGEPVLTIDENIFDRKDMPSLEDAMGGKGYEP